MLNIEAELKTIEQRGIVYVFNNMEKRFKAPASGCSNFVKIENHFLYLLEGKAYDRFTLFMLRKVI